MATMEYPAMGYGLRYEYGMFRQTIQDGWQREQPENWLRHPDPGEVVRQPEKVEVKLNCSFQLKEGRLRISIGTPSVLIGIPYDRPVVGYGGRTINTLRFWAAAVPDSFDFEGFSHGELVGAVTESLAAESLTRVLYPDDSTIREQGLRFVQEYFLVACSLADFTGRFRAANEDWTKFPDEVAIQLKDTHPAITVPELMRILLDEVPLPWDEAWNIPRRALAYTNHTLLPELSRSGQWIGSKKCCPVSSRSFTRSIADSSTRSGQNSPARTIAHGVSAWSKKAHEARSHGQSRDRGIAQHQWRRGNPFPPTED